MAHATNDINAVRNALGRGIVMLVDALFICILTVIIMFNTIDWRLTLMAMAPYLYSLPSPWDLAG